MNAVSTNDWANQIVGLVWQAQAFVLAVIRLSERDHLPTLLIALRVRESWVFACFGYGACTCAMSYSSSVSNVLHIIIIIKTMPATSSLRSMPRQTMPR